MATGDFKNGTALTGGILAQGQCANTATTAYTVPAATYVKVAKVIFANEDSAAHTVTYGATKSGSTGGAAGTLQGKTVAVGAAGATTATLDATELDGMILGPGDFLSFSADASSKVTYTVSGMVSA